MKKTVLVADDNSANLYLLKSILEAQGWVVCQAENGKVALEMVRARRPDLIVSDILMPVMDGYSFCRECKKDETLRLIPFVFYTATYTESKDEQFAMDLGADRFILKPEEPEVLVKILSDLLDEKSRISLTAAKPLGEEMEFFRRHNEILFSKLEKKMSDLETANQELRKLEEEYRLSFENATDIIFVVGDDLQVLTMSPSVGKILGYKPADFIGRTVFDLKQILPPESLEQGLANINRILNGAIITSTVYQIIARDQSIKHLEINGSPLVSNGRIIGIICIARDITERKLAEEDLRQAEERYRSIFENAQEGMYRATAEDKFIMVNQAMARIFGYHTPEEFMAGVNNGGHQLYLHGEDLNKVFHLLEQQGFVRHAELQFRRKDGTVGWVSLNIQPVRAASGKNAYYDGFIHDITDRKESVEHLREAFAGTVQAIASLVEMRDPYTAGHQRRVADIARTIAREMGLSREQVEGLSMAGIIHDIGKVSIPAEILCSPRRLTALEFNLIKTHAQSGYDILKDIKFSWPIARMVLEHHERMDGSGYPNGLTGNNILLDSRILAVADVVEAMATHRPYRPALGLELALQEITKNRGVLFDEEVVDACLCLFRKKGYTIKD